MIAQLVNHAHVFPAAMNAEGTIDRLLVLLDARQIEQAVCFAPFPASNHVISIRMLG